MSGALNLLIGLAMGFSLIALASSRLPSVIRAVALQGMVLGTLPLLLEEKFHWLVIVVAVGTIVIKGMVIPSLLRRALRAANIDREVEPLIGFVPSLLIGAAATVGATVFAGAFATVVCGLILLMARTKAISQVCGYLILENGIYLFGLLLINSTPLLVEAGILLDLTVAVFVIGIIMDRIQHEFDTLDTQKLTTLHE